MYYGNALAAPKVSMTRSRTKIRKIRKLLRKGSAVTADFTKKVGKNARDLRNAQNLRKSENGHEHTARQCFGRFCVFQS